MFQTRGMPNVSASGDSDTNYYSSTQQMLPREDPNTETSKCSSRLRPLFGCFLPRTPEVSEQLRICVVAAWSHGLQGLTTPSVAHGPAASLGAIRDTGSQAEPRSSEPESAS